VQGWHLGRRDTPAMPINVHIPIRIRVDAATLASEREAVARAIVAAATRALRKSQTIILAPFYGAVAVCLNRPEIKWTGDAAGRVPAAARIDFETLVAAALTRAASDARLSHLTRAPARPPAPPHAVAETVDPDRLTADGGGYVIPSYDQKKGGRPTTVTVSYPDQVSALSEAQLKRVRSTAAQLEKDDGTLFTQVIAGTRAMRGRAAPDPVNLEILRAFAKSDQAKYRKLLLAAVTDSAGTVARVYQLTDTGLKTISKDKSATEEAKRRLSILADALHLRVALPQGAWLVAELERRLPGIERLVALIEPLIAAQQKLLDYLVPLGEKQDISLIEMLRGIDLWQFAALIVTLAGGQQGVSTYQPQQDLLAYYRALATAMPKIQEIDRLLLIYRLSFGPAAEQVEEVDVLMQARRLYVDLLFDAMPGNQVRRRPILAQLDAAERFYGDYYGLVYEKKVEHETAAVNELLQRLVDIPPYAAGIGRNDWYGEFNTALNKLQRDVASLVGELKRRRHRVPGDPYTDIEYTLRQRLRDYHITYSIITFWKGALDLPVWGEMGSDADFDYWSDQTFDLRLEIVKQYRKPDYPNLALRMDDWSRRLDALIKFRNDAAEREVKENRRKFWKNLIVTVVVLVITHRVSGLAELRWGLSATELTLFGAGTFTALSTAGRSLLGESVSAREVVVSLGENATFGFLFGALNIRFVALGRLLAPGRDLAQLAVVLGADAVVGTGVSVGLNLIRTGDLPEDMQSFVLSTLVVAGTGAILGGPKLREQLVKLKIRDDFLAEFDRLRKEGAAALDEIRKFDPQGPSEAQHTALKQRLLRVLPDLDHALKRLAGSELSDADLAALALSRPQLAYLRNLVVQYFEIVRNSQWSAPSAPSGRQPPVRLPPPYVVRGVVEVGPETFEYNPSAPELSPDQVAQQLRGEGYHVTDGGGGVLRLTGGERPLLLLPAGPSVPAPPLARLVTPPGPRAAEVLQKARTYVAIGLRRVQQQNVVPSLEAILTSIAASDPDTARTLLEGFGRHLPPTETVALQGLANFLQLGGKPQTLAVILGLGNDYGTTDVRGALAQFTRLRASDLPGIEAIVALRGETRSGLDRIVGIAVGFREPREVFATIGVMAPRTESGLDQLVRQLASAQPSVRQEAEKAMLDGQAIVVRSPTRRIRFEQHTINGKQVLVARDAGVTAARTVRSYSAAELDDIVARTSDIRAIRQLAQGMVQGSSGSLFERWARRYVFEARGGIKASRIRIRQVDNTHIRLNKSERVSDAFLTADGEWWDAKAYQSGNEIDDVQLEDNRRIVKAKRVYTQDGVEHRVTSHNYLFIDRDSAMANLTLVKVQGDGRVWYIDDTGHVQPL
jgi:hypothetical protein